MVFQEIRQNVRMYRLLGAQTEAIVLHRVKSLFEGPIIPAPDVTLDEIKRSDEMGHFAADPPARA